MTKTKRFLASVLVIVIMFLLMIPASAEVLGGSSKIMVNSKTAADSSSTANYNGILLVPAREFVESLGGTFRYDAEKMTGTAQVGDNELVYHLDDSNAMFDGKYIQSIAPMKIINYRFMIPAEFTARKLEADYYFSSGRNTSMVFQPSDGKLIYKVMPGDTLWIISQLFGVTISSLRALNGISGDMLYIGQALVIKDLTFAPASIAAYTTGGATLFSGAGFNYSVVNYLKAWTDITVTGKAGPWYRVATPKGNGYLYYTVTGMKQDFSFGQNSAFFDGSIPVDTSKDTVSYIDYTVQKGDYIWALSQKYGIPDYELAQANNFSPYTTLYPNQVIKIPVHNIPVKDKLGPEYGEILDWFKEAQYVLPIGKTGRLIDIKTGKSFNVKRTMGANHSDTETLTADDTNIMKDIFGGWNWTRRPFILEVDGRRLAVSVAGMPHAGVDGQPYLATVDNRSDNWGTGPNDDSISGNGMDGHFDLYFLNCLRHVDNKIDPQHQYEVLEAGGLR